TGASGSIEVSEAVATAALPAEFPIAELFAPGIPSPGHTLVPVNSSNFAIEVNAAVIAYDEEGIPCFFLEIDDQLEDAVPYGDGLLITSGLEQRVARYVRWDGTEEWAFTLDQAAVAPFVPVQAALAERFHHDVFPHPELPDRFLALARRPVEHADWRASYLDPGVRADRVVSDDILVDFGRDGTVHSELRLSEVVPMDRIGFDSLEDVYPGWGDWSHANSLVWDAGSYVVSLRHQDAVVKIDAVTHELKWILGTPDNWLAPWSDRLLQPEGDLRWQWHQHAAELGPDAPDGRRQLVVFDNANWQASPFTGDAPVEDPITRVVQFGIDEENLTVRMDWSYETSTVTGASMFSEAVGDADFLPNGHVLSTWGMLAALPDGTPNEDAGLGNRSVRIIELDPTTLQDVWHLYLSVPGSANPDGWTAYRSERIPSQYGRTVD
ncbi:MAG: aryl-sulfate sulfotransferase, partial [Deltaproteobacteria bacterium]|nr:aryl-sulfate sulfotransferase [Deltaproteobacteria bacterium]